MPTISYPETGGGGGPGPAGPTGPAGPAGVGVPGGGATGEVLAKASGADYDTEWIPAGGGGAVSSVFTRTGAVVATAGDYQIGLIDGGANNAFAFTDGTGFLANLSGYTYNPSVFDGARWFTTVAPASGPGGDSLHRISADFNPAVTDSQEFWQGLSVTASAGTDNSGNQVGGSGSGGMNAFYVNARSVNESDVWAMDSIVAQTDIGNGTDAVSVNNASGVSSRVNVGAASNVDSISVINGVLNAGAGSTVGFLNMANVSGSVSDATGINVINTALQVENSGSLNTYAAGCSLTGEVTSGTNAYVDFQNFSGKVQSYNSIGLFPNINEITNSYNGVSVLPSIADCGAAIGVNVSMDNVNVFPGSQSSAVIQDLTLTYILNGDFNSTTIEFIPGGTAGAEVATFILQVIEVQIDSGVSTATQVKAALDANPQIAAVITTAISGTASNPQVSGGPVSFTGGASAGQKLAGFFDGDVQIEGSLSFNGALSIGQLNAFYQVDTESGTFNPRTLQSLVTSVTAQANSSTTNADTLGVNTAMLINLEANSTTTSGPLGLGLTPLALPCVVRTEAGATLDFMNAAVFALNMDGTSTGGTINQVRLCRAVVIPNGITTITRMYGFAYETPFGPPAVDAWSVYGEDDPAYLEVGLKVGGAPGVDDRPDAGYELHVEGDTKLEGELAHESGNVGFYGTAPVAQPASSGPQTAGGTYGATEQTMLQEVYNAMRALGLMS